MTSMVLLVLACSADPAGPVPERPAADVSEPGTPRPPRDVRDRARAEQTLLATAYYGVVDDPGRLVARPVRVATPGAGGSPVLAALERSAVATDPRLVALVPPRAFASAGFDGFGRHGSWGLQLRRPFLAARPAGWSRQRARLAVRAVLCTVASLDRPRPHPVSVYPPRFRPEVDRLFGVSLPADRRSGPCPS